MAGTLIFIHGTGVRKAGYDETMQKLRDGLRNAGRPDIDVFGYLWGDALGVQIDAARVDAILPLASTRAIGGSDAQWETALWEQLLQDPLFELRMAAIREAQVRDESGAPLPGSPELADIVVAGRVASLAARLQDPLAGGVPARTMAGAAEAIAQSSELAAAATAAPDPDDVDLNDAIARAVVAEALLRSRGEIGTGPDALFVIDERRELVRYVASLLVPATRGIPGWLFGKIKGAAEAWATSYGRKRREGLMTGGGPAVGDVLLYQRRSGAFLDAIEAEIVKHAENGPVVALGHSLGGIMLVDLLSRPRAAGPLPVAKLITVGSQAPALYMCDALNSMRAGKPLPPGAPFTPWLNVYDRNDFLSFCASRCFPGAPGPIDDFEIRSGVSFPDSHSAYFRQTTFFDELVKVWP